ncbi:hypothetical protein EL18_02113 [Nitratireductor basaltis]|uniref:Uncharacterized protein n=1 Tax=Nitratireductor basaltis TaxID=472175 RepID=A0A084UDN5_9HYPH|nr:hypothetical protein EL18_02113 [Nitratireductor basaltis]
MTSQALDRLVRHIIAATVAGQTQLAQELRKEMEKSNA